MRPRDRGALGVVLLLVLVAAYYLVALKPEHQKASALTIAIAAQRRTLITAQSNYAAGRSARASLAVQGPAWAALRRAVPNSSDIPALLRILESNAKAVHVQMQSIQLSDSGSQTAGASASTTSGATSVPLQLAFAGSYAGISSLIHRLDGLVVVSGNTVHATGPLVSISDVSLSSSPGLTVQLTATIYQLEPAPAVSATAGSQ